MSSSNPAFAMSPAFTPAKRASVSVEELDELYGRPSATSAQTDRMSYNDVIMKTIATFGVLLAGAAIGWMVPILALPGMIIGLVLALVNIFKKSPSRGLILAYAGFQGLFVGGISAIFNTQWDGIVTQAVFGTLAVVGVTLFLFMNGTLRSSPRLTKIFIVAMVGYLVFSLTNFGLMAFGVTEGMFGLRSIEFFGIPLGFFLGIFVVLLAAYSLVLDFESIKAGVDSGAPAKFGWQAAFGIIVTVVWLYVEILRLLAILRGE
jgi:uncharacterized YccA/Bax inhibitor family protein